MHSRSLAYDRKCRVGACMDPWGTVGKVYTKDHKGPLYIATQKYKNAGLVVSEKNC